MHELILELRDLHFIFTFKSSSQISIRFQYYFESFTHPVVPSSDIDLIDNCTFNT